MSLKLRINDDMKAAMKDKDGARLAAIRLLMAAMKQKEVDERVELDDTAVAAVIEKLVKQRKDSVTQYTAAGRQDLADAEKFEVTVLESYMPQALTEAELDAAVAKAIAEAGAKAPADMGKVMGLLKPAIAGRADMGKASALVRQRLV